MLKTVYRQLGAFVCVMLVAGPAFAQMGAPVQERTMPVEQFSPAPNVPRPIPTQEQIREAIEQFRVNIQSNPPDTVESFRACVNDFGRHLGLATDLMTIAGAEENRGYIGGLHRGLSNLGMGITVLTLIDKSLIQGEDIGLDVAWEASKFLVQQVAGGPVAAAMGILKYQLDILGNAVLKQIDDDFYRAYVEYHLYGDKTAEHIWKLFAEENSGLKVAETLDKFWDDPVAHGIHGWYTMKVQYDKKPQDKELYKQAYRNRILHEFIYPAFRDAMHMQMVDMEMEMIFAAELESKGLIDHKVKVSVENIIDQGRFAPAEDLIAYLTHSDKYLIASAPVTKRGVEFEFPEGKMFDPQTKEPVKAFALYLAPSGSAKFPDYDQYVKYPLPLDVLKANIKQEWRNTKTAYEFKKPFFVQLAYPVKVILEGEGMAVSSVWAKKTAGSLGGRSFESWNINAKSGKDNVYLFDKMPTGHKVFSSDAGILGKAFVAKAGEFTFKRPPTPFMDETVKLPPMPDFSADSDILRKKIEELGDLQGNRPAEDIRREAEKMAAEMAFKWAEFETLVDAAAAKMEKRKLLISGSALEEEEKEKRLKVIEEAWKKLWEQKEISLAETDKIDAQIYALLSTVEEEIGKKKSALDKDYRGAEDRLRELLNEAERMSFELQREENEIFTESYQDNLRYSTQEEAESRIKELQNKKEVNLKKFKEYTDIMAQLEKAYAEFQSMLEKKRLLAVYEDYSLPQPKDIPSLEAMEKARKQAQAFDKAEIVQNTEKAVKAIEQRHKIRKDNAAELNEIIQNIQSLETKIPAVDKEVFEKALKEFSKRFDQALEDDKADFLPIAQALTSFIDAHKEILGDLRMQDKQSKTVLGELDVLSEKMRAITASRTAYTDRDKIKQLAPVWKKRASGLRLRRGEGAALIAMEKDLYAAAGESAAYRKRFKADAGLIAKQTEKTASEKSAEQFLRQNEAVWQLIEKMPAHRQFLLKEQLAEQVKKRFGEGALKRYAEEAKRPLVIIESYTYAHLENDDKALKRVNSAFVNIEPPADGKDPYTAVLNCRVAGLAENKSAYIELSSRYYTQQFYYRPAESILISVPSTMAEPMLRVFGTGKDHVPMAYPFLKQIMITEGRKK